MARYRDGEVLALLDDEPAVYGHVGDLVYIKAMVDSGEWDEGDVPEYLPLELHHEWWRCVPAPKDDPDLTTVVVVAKAEARGAFRVTVRTPLEARL